MSDELPNNVNSVAIQAVAVTSKKALLSLEKDIQDELYYHGFMSKLEAEVLLKKHGHFLVRRIQEATNLYYVVSVQWKEEKLHYKINQTSRKHYFYLNHECKKTVVGLIRFHRQNQVPINETTKACLTKAVNRHHYTIFREQVTLGAYISSGEFGAVYAGLLRVGLFSRVDVAVKTMKLDEDKLSMDQRIVFLREANIMMRLKHKNVIRLYGVCVYEDPIWIVMECAKGGSLLKRLQNSESPPDESLKIKFSKEICLGMAYLESFMVIHRDLAARNCLLGKKETIKIADFGLSNKGLKSLKIGGGRVPIRWMPPETMNEGIFTSKSDVWSFGCVLFEIWSNGQQPYGEELSVRQIGQGVKRGTLRLLPPQNTPESMSSLMQAALTSDPTSRPSFDQLKHRL